MTHDSSVPAAASPAADRAGSLAEAAPPDLSATAKTADAALIRRALIQVSALLTLASCVSLTSLAEFLDGPDGVLPTGLADWVQFGSALITALWLAWTVSLRIPPVASEPALRRHGFPRLVGTAVGLAVVVYATTPASSRLGDYVAGAIHGCLLAWLALEVCRAHGVPLRAGFLTADARQQRQTWLITKWAFVACVMGPAVTGLLTLFVHWSGMDGIPVLGDGGRSGQDEQEAFLGFDSAWSKAFAYVRTVAIEDVVIVAAATTLLTAARRPAWQVYTTICAIEVALHSYFGVPAIGTVVFAAGRVWLYRRYGCIAPLVIAHAFYNGVYTEFARLPDPYSAISVPLLLVVALGFDRWLMKRAEGPPP
ncbi:hypothetical protein OG478_13880 [Streptomyces phaeochromogenes]|uniref:hypothetical protein n=1 Tax=Streptomyces phaeochromogenes TaxID=1923 RepID=UPI00386AB662|nr:hypothetical protein OG478_13880 [Streptomyces phaeochromogenes]